jgi:branched-subunit amino acid aminotransferase/4-amino-4-deoxychorismate lyase
MNLPGHGRDVWLDGAPVPATAAALTLDDPAIHTGLGVFETVALDGGRPLDLAAHLDRMRSGAARLGVPLPARDALERVARDAAAAEPSSPGWLKIIATRGGHWAAFSGPLDPDTVGAAATAVVLPWRRHARDPLAGIKALAYAANRLGLEHARQRGADEGLWLDHLGMLTEGCASNLFVVRRRALFTAGASQGILPGVVRGHVLRAARHLGLVVHEGKLRAARLRQADEAFLTSSLRGVRPLVRVDGRTVGAGAGGPLTRAIADRVANTRRDR